MRGRTLHLGEKGEGGAADQQEEYRGAGEAQAGAKSRGDKRRYEEQ